MRKKLYSLLLVVVMAASTVACTKQSNEATNATEDTVEQSTSDTAEVENDDTADAEESKTDDASDEAKESKLDLEDGVYVVEFTTDSSMFHINEAYDNKAHLTVEDGVGTVHITLTSQKIVNLYPGLAADAEKNPDGVLQPTVDDVKYDDGSSETVNGFDVPVPAIDEEFDLALIGTKGTWYDHKVKVSNPIKE